MNGGPVSRRAAVAAAIGMVAGGLRVLAGQDSQPLAGQGSTGTLYNPGAAGAPRSPTAEIDNEEFIKSVEHRLHCTCGCNLDVYTCRTTDFTCGTSPRMHREVVTLYQSGQSAQQIVDAFVARYGEQVLMAPKPEGFNLAGYLVPGVLVAVAGLLLALRLGRRRAMAAPAPAPDVTATPEELERLRKALAEVEG